MAYKTLFTTVTNTDAASAAVEQAKVLCRAWDAHLDVLTMGIDRSQAGYYYAGVDAMILQESLQRAETEAKDLMEQVKTSLNAEDIRWNAEASVAAIADLGRHVAGRARFADLAVMPQPYGEGLGVELEPVLEAALFDGGTPVLMVPTGAEAKSDFKRVVIGWNESNEALNAVRAALPLLKAADFVSIAVIAPPAHGPERSDPGGRLSEFLSRHGVHVEISVLAKTMPKVSDVLLRHTEDTNADLLVMGAYGHSRFREAILGGATRGALENAKLPIFLSH